MSYPMRTLLLLLVLSSASAAALLAQPVTPGVRNDPPPAARDSAPPPKPAPMPAPVKQEPPKPVQVDPKRSARDGRKLAEQVVAAVGGLDAWNDKSWDLAFDFVMYKGKAETGRYSHIWYRSLDRYIVSGKNRDGKLWRVRFTSLSRHEGSGTIDGRDVADSSRGRMLESAYGRYINDTYWFLMPFKLLDSGVYHRREADTTIGGKRYLVLTLSFAKVGLTPGDQYRLFINPRTKLVERWHYKLQSNHEGEFIWSDYKRFGRLLLPTRRKAVDGSFEIRFENIRVDDDEKEKNRRRID